MIQRQIFEYNDVLGCRFIPKIKARVQHESGGYLLRTNSCGFRCKHDFLVQKKNNINRILLFGDSFTAGDGVSDNKRYSEVLERKIEALEVFNYGLPGSGTDQQYLAYQTFAKEIDHDILVIAVLVENIRRVASHYRYYKNDQRKTLVFAKPFYELENDELILKQCPPAKAPIEKKDLPNNETKTIDTGGRFQLLRKLVTKAGLKDLVQKSIKYQPVPEYNSATNPVWLIMHKILENWIVQHQKPVILMPIPLYQHVEETSDASAYQTRFQELSDTAGCTLHDPLTDLLKYTPEQRRKFRFEHDIHLTPKGHEAIATSVAPVIKKILLTHSEGN
jgi:lysophospholipase L1-like esterase